MMYYIIPGPKAAGQTNHGKELPKLWGQNKPSHFKKKKKKCVLLLEVLS
jgi:hypothetical protein